MVKSLIVNGDNLRSQASTKKVAETDRSAGHLIDEYSTGYKDSITGVLMM